MSTTGMREHTSQDFEAELAAIRRKLLAMGRQVDEVVEASGRALVNRDAGLANQIILSDHETDDMEMEIDHLCLEVLARRQPVAGDLRLLTSALKLVVDLERVGDMGVSIATRVLELVGKPPPISYDELMPMFNAAREMVSDALAALITGDVERAQRVIARDDVVDSYYAHFFNQLVGRTRDGTIDVGDATSVQAVSKYVERIGDHAVNMAERVIFVLTGEDVRHLPRARRASGDVS
jgi:phosphate transport system protein